MTGESTHTSQEVNIDKQRLGAVYAKALLGATEPQQMSEAVVGELDALIDELFGVSPNLENVLGSPRVSAEEKKELLNRVFEGKISDQLLTFLKVVAQHGRLDCLRHIRTAARNELNAMRQRVMVVITTAEPMGDDQKHHLYERLAKKLGHDVHLDCRVDEDIIGGLVVRVGDTVFDASVANQLERIKDQTIQKSFTQLRESIDRFAVSG